MEEEEGSDPLKQRTTWRSGHKQVGSRAVVKVGSSNSRELLKASVGWAGGVVGEGGGGGGDVMLHSCHRTAGDRAASNFCIGNNKQLWTNSAVLPTSWLL